MMEIVAEFELLVTSTQALCEVIHTLSCISCQMSILLDFYGVFLVYISYNVLTIYWYLPAATRRLKTNFVSFLAPLPI